MSIWAILAIIVVGSGCFVLASGAVSAFIVAIRNSGHDHCICAPMHDSLKEAPTFDAYLKDGE